jgi:hydrogenase maturation factor HypE
MKLSDAESARFVPIYDAYEKDLTEVNRKLTRVGVEYVNMGETISDAQAKQLSKDLLAFEDAESKLRRRYYQRVAKAVGEKKATRFLQIENKIRAVARYDAAMTIPLVE